MLPYLINAFFFLSVKVSPGVQHVSLQFVGGAGEE